MYPKRELHTGVLSGLLSGGLGFRVYRDTRSLDYIAYIPLTLRLPQILLEGINVGPALVCTPRPRSPKQFLDPESKVFEGSRLNPNGTSISFRIGISISISITIAFVFVLVLVFISASV